MLRHLPLAILLLIVASATARAQYAGGYAFTGASGPNGLVQIGGGLERVLGNGIGVSVEGGVATRGDRYSKLSHITINGLYHFKTRNERLDPFVVAGWGMVADWDAAVAAFAAGGGLNYWARPRVAVRVEYKDNIGLLNNGFHMPGIRVGVTLR